MHRHLYVVRSKVQHAPPRPAKVVQLEARRKARAERLDPKWQPPLKAA
jgi:hypothetical protein